MASQPDSEIAWSTPGVLEGFATEADASMQDQLLYKRSMRSAEDYYRDLPPELKGTVSIDTIPWTLLPSVTWLPADIITPEIVKETKAILYSMFRIWSDQVPDKSKWLLSDRVLQMAKICLVLQVMGQQSILQNFIASGKTDESLPLKNDELLHILPDAELRKEFSIKQYKATARDIPEGTDITLNDCELEPFQQKQELGRGGQGTVYVVQNIFTRNLYARKRLKSDGRNVKVFESELSNLRKLGQHQHIVRLVSSYRRARDLCLLLLPVADTNLHDFLEDFPKSPDRKQHAEVLYRSFGCLASALDFMHTHKIRHKDIKPANILIHSNNVLFTDFGSAFDFSDFHRSTTSGKPGLLSKKYCAPEVANWESRGRPSDVFSLGCVFLQITTVLSGRNLEDLDIILLNRNNESDNGRFCKNLDSVKRWIAELQLCCNGTALTPSLNWCLQMLEEKPRVRPQMRDMVKSIAMDSIRVNRLVDYFCHNCFDQIRSQPLRENREFVNNSQWESSLGFGTWLEGQQSLSLSFANAPAHIALNDPINDHPPALTGRGFKPDLIGRREVQGGDVAYPTNPPAHQPSDIDSVTTQVAFLQLSHTPRNRLYVVTFKCYRSDIFYIQEGTGLHVKTGDLVIVEAGRGYDLGTVAHADVTWPEAKEWKEFYSQEHFKWLMIFSRQSSQVGNPGIGQSAMLATQSNGPPGSVIGGVGRPQPVHQGMQGPSASEVQPGMIKRLAQMHEIQTLRDKEGNEARAKKGCQQKVQEHHLQMEILDAEFQMDWKKLTFYYFHDPDTKLNLKPLVIDLCKVYKTRIWMTALSQDFYVNTPMSMRFPSGLGPGVLSIAHKPSIAHLGRQNHPIPNVVGQYHNFQGTFDPAPNHESRPSIATSLGDNTSNQNSYSPTSVPNDYRQSTQQQTDASLLSYSVSSYNKGLNTNIPLYGLAAPLGGSSGGIWAGGGRSDPRRGPTNEEPGE